MFTYYLENTILESKRALSSFSLLFLDLDHFKDINDTLGHDQGDILLIEATRRILHCVREADTVARFGGDEFVLLLTNTNTNTDLDIGAAPVVEKILASLSAPFSLQGREFHISASIGVVHYPNDGQDGTTLMKNADLAMYFAKASGRNCWKAFHDIATEGEKRQDGLKVEG
jgi:diguanylate cyclase (GGDEF)-like protein